MEDSTSVVRWPLDIYIKFKNYIPYTCCHRSEYIAMGRMQNAFTTGDGKITQAQRDEKRGRRVGGENPQNLMGNV